MNNSLFLRLWLSIAAVIIASILLVSLALDYYHNGGGEIDFVSDIGFVVEQLENQDSQRWAIKAELLSELTGFAIKQLSPEQKQLFVATHEWLETRDGIDVYAIDEHGLAGLNGLLMVSDGPDKPNPQELTESFESLFLLAFIFIAIALVLYFSVQRIAQQVSQLSAASEALANGDLSSVDPADLGSLLGAEAQAGLEALQGMVLMLQESGHLREREGRVELTPQAVRKLGQLALRDIYEDLMRDRSGGHESRQTGAGAPSLERVRPWDFGDPLRLALVPTLMGAVRRGGGSPLNLEPSDFVIRETEQETSVATVLLLDMSWSMSWEGRFVAAKKVALALETLVRTRFPNDYFGMVGFYTKAVELTPLTLPEATWSMGDPFTNLQDGLRMAGRLLQRHAGRNQQIIVITDGQPTAYYVGGQLHCEWPMSMGGVSRRAAEATLGEVARLTRRGVTINTFMLDDSAGLRAFVDEMTRINRGRALYTRPDQLGSYLMVDYLGRKTKRL